MRLVIAVEVHDVDDRACPEELAEWMLDSVERWNRIPARLALLAAEWQPEPSGQLSLLEAS